MAGKAQFTAIGEVPKMARELLKTISGRWSKRMTVPMTQLSVLSDRFFFFF
jgi:hypothetical protein